MKKKLEPRLRQDIAIRLNALLLATGMKDADMARRLKISPQTWNNYSQGERPLPIPIALKLVEEFKVTLDWLYRGDSQNMPHGLMLTIQQNFQSAERLLLS